MCSLFHSPFSGGDEIIYITVPIPQEGLQLPSMKLGDVALLY